jgi:ABC-type antimicrobial peptide transport system permease subunit
MKNIIFLMVMACLLAGCTGNTKPDFKVAVQGGEKQTQPLRITTESDMPVVVKAQGNEALPIKIVPDKIVIGAFVASLVAVIATCLAAIAAWRAAYNAKKALEEIKKRSDE